jgi:hypothetical protein
MCCANAARHVLIYGGEPELSEVRRGDVVDIQTGKNTNKGSHVSQANIGTVKMIVPPPSTVPDLSQVAGDCACSIGHVVSG